MPFHLHWPWLWFWVGYAVAGIATAAVCCRKGCVPCESKDTGSIVASVIAWPLLYTAGVLVGCVCLLAVLCRKVDTLARHCFSFVHAEE